MSQSFLVAISRRRPWNLCCHSAQCARMAPLMGEQSSKTNSLFTSVSSFWTLLAISEYLRREGGRGEGKNNLNVFVLCQGLEMCLPLYIVVKE